ncbi:PP2C family protein-serine/threonine phosphatase [Tumidithrix helvetica PCC 7403]|uniref:PP2C family protein-serine/threonine phosphatase n=1 Tax=Tumidithrix helvetica TaxID=3457545 RepID=UPI003CB4D1F0
MSLSLPPRKSSPPKKVSRTELDDSLVLVKDLKEILRRSNQDREKISELLSFLGYALRSLSNLNQFLELIPLIACRVTDSDGGALILFKSSGQMSLESLHCPDNGAHGMQSQQVRYAIERAIQQVFSGSTTALDELVSRYLGADVHLFGTSILVKNAVRGRLYIFSRKTDYPWDDTKRKLMRLVADQTAVGLENNELAAELIKKERQDRELEIGAEIQRQLLPRNCPVIQGIEIAARCLTASRVGGDYYDFIPIQKGERWSFVVGDVMGKGVPAGLIMTMTRGMLRAEVLNSHSPSKILEHLNEVMYDDLEKSHRFVTMFYSEYDPKTQILSFSNAAHTPALLWRSQTRTVHALDTVGALIGLEVGSKFEERSVHLQPNDVVIYYTDGFTEAANDKGDRFDEENLRQALDYACQHCIPESSEINHPQAILDYIFKQVQDFIGEGHSHSDDMTLVVLKCQNKQVSA